MNARIRVDVCGRFTINASIPKEKLDCCPVELRKHTHRTVEELKKCYLGKQRMFEASRRVEWQLLLNSAKLKEANEPCSKCRCFWKGHDQEKCRGVGTKDDNLLVIHGHYYLEVIDLLKKIVEDSKSNTQEPCPVCSTLVSHEWLECLKIAQYNPLTLLDCDINVRPRRDHQITTESSHLGRGE